MPSIDRLYSAEKRIDEKIDLQTIKDKINSGVANVREAAQEISKTVSLKIDSFFKTKDFPKVAAAGPTARPEAARTNRASLGGQGILLFPAEMKYYTMFAFKQYNRGFALKASNDKATATIILPMPSNLTESFAVSYETPALGPIVGALTESLTNQARNAGPENPGESSLGKTSVATGVAVIAQLAMSAAKSTSEAAGAPGIGAGLKMISGVAPNPHLAVIFENVGLREHTFNYKFAPRSAAEMETLKRIISSLKKSLLPGLSASQSVLFSFPDVCDISFGPYKDSPYRIKRCVMTNLSVNHAASGTIAFHKGGDPVMVEINMTFKEMGAFTRADLQTERMISDAAVADQAEAEQLVEDAASGRQRGNQ